MLENMIVFLTSKNREEYFDKLFDFCSRNFENKPIFQNYDVIDWENKPHTLLYVLYIEKRFDECGYGVYIDENNKIIAGSGMYRSEFNNDIFVIACRTLKDKSCRGYDKNVMRYIWSEQVKIIKEKNAKGVMMTYDVDKESRMVKSFFKNKKLLQKSRLVNNTIPELQNLKILDFPIKMKGVYQYIVYKIFDEKENDNILDLLNINEKNITSNKK
jgi:hypothetical protein